MITGQLIKQTYFDSTWWPQALVRLLVLGMGVLCLIRWWIFKRVKSMFQLKY